MKALFCVGILKVLICHRKLYNRLVNIKDWGQKKFQLLAIDGFSLAIYLKLAWLLDDVNGFLAQSSSSFVVLISNNWLPFTSIWVITLHAQFAPYCTWLKWNQVCLYIVSIKLWYIFGALQQSNTSFGIFETMYFPKIRRAFFSVLYFGVLYEALL